MSPTSHPLGIINQYSNFFGMGVASKKGGLFKEFNQTSRVLRQPFERKLGSAYTVSRLPMSAKEGAYSLTVANA